MEGGAQARVCSRHARDGREIKREGGRMNYEEERERSQMEKRKIM